MPYVKAGRIKLLAVGSEKRLAALPTTPTFTEAGYPAIVLPTWTGIFAAAGTPAPIVVRLSQEISRIMRDPDVIRKAEEFGAQATPRNSAEFSEFLKVDLKRWENAARVTGITIE